MADESEKSEIDRMEERETDHANPLPAMSVSEETEARRTALEEALERNLARKEESLGLAFDAWHHDNQHNSVTGRRNAISMQYLSAPSVEEYVRLRRLHPETLIEISTSWAIEWVFANEDVLKQHSIEPELVVGTLDADPAHISELSLRLMERLIERDAKLAEGQTHLARRQEAIGDSLVKYLISMMLDALDWNNQLEIPRDLIVLLKHVMGTEDSGEARAMQVHQNRGNAKLIAAQIRNSGGAGSIRQIAQIMGVSASTVSRWFPAGDFEDEVSNMQAFLKSDYAESIREIAERQRKRKRDVAPE